MKTYFFTTLALIILPFSVVSNVFAQTDPPCGTIITPANYLYEGSEEYLDPLTDCTNPFNRTSDLTSLKLNNQTVVNNTTYPIDEAGTASFGLAGETYNNRSGIQYYRHQGSDYVRVNTEFESPTAQAMEAEITNFFPGNPARTTYYTEIFNSSNQFSYFLVTTSPRVFRVDPFDTSKRVIDVYNELEQYIRKNAKSPRKPLTPGTYTAVQIDTDEGPNPTFEPTLIKKIFAKIIPTAHAYYYVNTVTFTLTGPTPEPVGASSVLFLPGIQASRLYKGGLAGSEDQIWVPDGNQDVRQLAMNSGGVSQNQIYTKGILENLPYTGKTVYDSFARSMVNLVNDEVIESWTPFAYDWRYSVNDIALNGTKYENDIRDAIDEIEYLAENSYTDKVTIIGHSNGGLLAKAIVKRLEQEGKANLIDRIVFLASPQLGTSKAIGTILHGYDQEKFGGWAIDDVVARDVIQNMPGAYGLVTSQSYFNKATDKVIKFENSTSTLALRNAYGPTIDSEEELSRFMEGASDGRAQASTIDEILRANESLLAQQLNLHNTSLDTWAAPANIEIIEIIGTGLDTVSGFEYRGFTERVCTLGVFSCQTKEFYKPIPLISTKGDKTVISLSAEGYTGTKEQYFIDLKKVEDIKINEAVEHYNISENPSIQKLIKNILLATSTDIEFISKNNTNTNNNRVLLGVHSPAEIEVISTNGKRVGKKVVGGVTTKEEDIVGSSYFEIGTSKYIIVPADVKYNIKLSGTAEGGLTFSVDKLNGSTQVPEIAVQVATITGSTSIKISYESNNVLSNLEIDSNGDSVTDTLLTPQGVDITPKITYKNLRDKINNLSLSTIRKVPLLALVTAADILDKKSVTNPQLISAERFTLNQLEALLSTYQKKGWISQSTLDNLKFVINKLK